MTAPRDSAARRIRLAIVTNIPAPYRVPVLNRIAADPRIRLKVFYCNEREPDRSWDLGSFEHDHVFLEGRVFTVRGRYIHHNPEIFRQLADFGPDVVLTTGFNPTHLYAFAHAASRGIAHVAMTDGTDRSEAHLGLLHRWARRLVFRRSGAFVAASEGGKRLYRSYGIGEDRLFLSPLCANMDVRWDNVVPRAPGADFIFCGRFVQIKNPHFAVQVALRTAELLGRRTVLLVVGSGPLEHELAAAAARHAGEIEVRLCGFARQDELPGWYASARLLLFPTSWDPWGVIANEACAAGLPVIVSPDAGIANDLVLEGRNGFVRPLEVEEWARCAVDLLSDETLYQRFSAAARERVSHYNFDNAAAGIVEAALAAASR